MPSQPHLNQAPVAPMISSPPPCILRITAAEGSKGGKRNLCGTIYARWFLSNPPSPFPPVEGRIVRCASFMPRPLNLEPYDIAPAFAFSCLSGFRCFAPKPTKSVRGLRCCPSAPSKAGCGAYQACFFFPPRIGIRKYHRLDVDERPEIRGVRLIPKAQQHQKHTIWTGKHRYIHDLFDGVPRARLRRFLLYIIHD